MRFYIKQMVFGTWNLGYFLFAKDSDGKIISVYRLTDKEGLKGLD